MGRRYTSPISVNDIDLISDSKNNVLYESEDHKIMRLMSFGNSQRQDNYIE